MDILQLQYFSAIVKYGSMTSAARSLFVSQPNLSISMSRLEEDLGAALFVRRKGKIALTEAGQVFYEHVAQSLSNLDDGIAKLKVFSESNLSTSLRVATGLTDLLNSVFYKMRDKLGDARIKQITCDNFSIPRLVENSSVDMGIIFGEYVNELVEYLLLSECERVVLCGDQHPLAGRRHVRLSELKTERFICNNARDDKNLYEYLAAKNALFADIYCECDDPFIEEGMLVLTDCITFSPIVNYLKLRRFHPDTPLSVIRIDDEIPAAKIGMIRRAGHRLTAPALRLTSYIADQLANDTREIAEYFKRIEQTE